jgi:hypothetical protein
MEEINLDNLYGFYLEAINCCTFEILKKDDQELYYFLFEVLDIDVYSFLNETSLKKLTDAGYLNSALKIATEKLRDQAIFCLENRRDESLVRTDDDWRKLFMLGDELQKDLGSFNEKLRNTNL